MSELPSGWQATSLGEIGLVQSGVGFPSEAQGLTSGDYPVYKVGDVSRGVLQAKGNLKSAANYVSRETAANLKGYIFPAGSTLFAKIGEALKLNRRAFVLQEGLADNNVMGYKADPGVSDRFVYHFLRIQDLAAFSRSTTVPSIRKGDVEGVVIPLPPTAEQTRIAAKLDELLAQVDTLKARIDGIPPLLKRFRQSVLAAAVSGQLTEEWRVGRATQTTEDESTLPGWTQTVFGEICREITVGYVGKMADQYREEGMPFLRSQNVRPMRFSPENILYISEEFHSSIFKSRLEPGDLAVVRSGAPGVTCVIPESLPIANCSDLVIARPSERLNSWFGCIYMNSEVAQRNVADNQVGVAQQHFNVGSMKKMPINLPPFEEQTEIVRRVEQLFAFADQLEAKVNEAKTRIDRLTQSILAKAFRGGLVPQDPNDEPASQLLERIKAQRASAPKAKRKRRVGAD